MVDILFFDPISIPLTRLLSKIPGLTPNMVTVASGLFGVASACCFFFEQFFLGAGIMYLSMMLDCVDGNLARKTGQTSPFGAKLDRITDSVKKVLCLAALTYVSEWPLWLLIGLIALHYGLFRVFPSRYPKGYREQKFTSHSLEPLFDPYDLLVILLFFGPMISFEIVLAVVIVIQVLISCFALTRRPLHPQP